MVNCCESGLAPCVNENARLVALTPRFPVMGALTAKVTETIRVEGEASGAVIVICPV